MNACTAAFDERAASNTPSRWFDSEAECESACDVKCSPCKRSGDTNEYYACLPKPQSESATVYGPLKGGSIRIVSEAKTP